MTDRDRAGFTHHEKLRYEYLLSNFQYLNERERQEFSALQYKMKRFLNQSPERQEQVVPNRAYRTEQSSSDSTLPVYPQSENKSKPGLFYSNQDVTPAKSPRKKGKFRKFFKVLALLLLLAVIGMIGMFFKGMLNPSSNQENLEPAVTEFFDGQDSPNGTNILILGSDQRVTEQSDSARADTIMVLNIGGQKGKMSLVSFMRDTLVNIPGASYDEGYYDHKLNAAFAIGEQDEHQGAELVRQVLKHNLDIDIKYYMMIDFQTFATAVDSLFPNGVEIDAQFATVDGEVVDAVDVPDDLNMANGIVPDQTIHVGKQRMDGRTLLNYARFRKDDEGDFGRTKRQQQVMAAILSQVKDPAKLFTGSEALGKIYALTSTNISYPFLLSQGLKSVATGQLNLERQTVPELGDWYDDYDAYGGLGLVIDFDKYQKRLRDMGLR